MLRIEGIALEDAHESCRPTYRQLADEIGNHHQLAVLAHRPAVLTHLMAMLAELHREQLVAQRYIEIAVVTASRINECQYCVTAHAPLLVRCGLPPETVGAILDADCPGFDAADTAVRDYAAAVTRDARRVSNALFARLKEHFTDAQIVEITVRSAMAGFFNRFNDALGIELEEGARDRLVAAGVAPADVPGAVAVVAGA